jgi:superfamily II DNA/RNA helicase
VPKTSRSRVPKKARWTAARKADAKRTTAPAQSRPRANHRGQPPSPASDRRRGYAGRPAPARDAEAERALADSWTRATTKTARAAATGPLRVASDNGFAALGVPERVVARLARDGITTPFPIQAATIPDALAGRDILGRGQTGSGKTLAFGLPTLNRLAGTSSAPKRPRALVLVPTRELAMQVSDALEPLVHVLGLRHKLVAGGLSYATQIAALDRGIDLLIATPGRLRDLLDRGAVDLGAVEVAVLDEADHMADMGFLPEVTSIFDEVPAGGQRLLFSATLDRGVDTLVERYLSDPVTHSTDEAKASVTTMAHHVLLVEPTHKREVTAHVANRTGRTVVFVRTKLGADRVASQLRSQGVLAAALHGGLTQSARNRVMGAFRDGTLPVLVATDVAARGIHVDDVEVVLQVDPPADHKDYLHRSGRTARAGEEGTVVTLALPHQRRTMERQLREAGVDIRVVPAAPGDAVLKAAGASEPTGVPVPDEEFRRIIQGPVRRREHPHRQPRTESSRPRRG